MSFKIDLRTIDKRSLIEKLRHLEFEAHVEKVIAHQDQTLEVFQKGVDPPLPVREPSPTVREPSPTDVASVREPLVLTDKPLDPNTLQGLAQFDRNVVKAVDDINFEQKVSDYMSITGAGPLGSEFRDTLTKLKEKIAGAHGQVSAAMGRLSSTADQATQMAKQIDQEATDLQAALGLSSNGPPA